MHTGGGTEPWDSRAPPPERLSLGRGASPSPSHPHTQARLAVRAPEAAPDCPDPAVHPNPVSWANRSELGSPTTDLGAALAPACGFMTRAGGALSHPHTSSAGTFTPSVLAPRTPHLLTERVGHSPDTGTQQGP